MATKFDFDLFLRDSQCDHATFIERYCEVFRPHAYATADGGMNEFEKLITHVLTMKCSYDALTNLMGVKDVYIGDALELTESDEITDGCDSLADAVKAPLDALREQIYSNLKASEFGGHADEEEMTRMAHTLALVYISKHLGLSA